MSTTAWRCIGRISVALLFLIPGAALNVPTGVNANVLQPKIWNKKMCCVKRHRKREMRGNKCSIKPVVFRRNKHMVRKSSDFSLLGCEKCFWLKKIECTFWRSHPVACHCRKSLPTCWEFSYAKVLWRCGKWRIFTFPLEKQITREGTIQKIWQK